MMMIQTCQQPTTNNAIRCPSAKCKVQSSCRIQLHASQSLQSPQHKTLVNTKLEQ